MNFLLDTHVFPWYTANDQRLTSSTKDLINDRSNLIYVSAASCWEIAIKLGLGKIELQLSLEDLLNLESHGLTLLDISLKDTVSYSKLPFPEPGHRDPSDRMLVVQALESKSTLLTADSIIAAYLPQNQILII